MTESVGSLVNDVLKNNRKALKSVIEAYRTGGVLLAQGIGVQLERVLEERAGRLNQNLRVGLVDNSGKVRDFWSNGIEKVSDTAEKTVDSIFSTASSAVEKVGERVEAVENPYAVKYLSYVEKAALPSAKLARYLSLRIAEGADTTYERLSPTKKRVGRESAVEVAKRGRTTTAKHK